jgi:putative redox protein
MTTFVSGSSSSVDDVDSSAPGIPSEFRKSYQISGVGRKSAVEMLTSTNHAIHSDVPKQMGGSNAAPQPVELLLASLLGCTQATATFVGRQMNPRILLDRLEMDIQAERDERGALELPIDRDPEIPARLQRVTGIVRVYTRNKQPLSDSQLELISHQTEERCPVANMVKSSGCVMDVEWVNGISKEEN